MKYDVYVWYATCVQVEAENEDEAELLARDMLEGLDDETFRSIVEISETDASEAEEVE